MTKRKQKSAGFLAKKDGDDEKIEVAELAEEETEPTLEAQVIEEKDVGEISADEITVEVEAAKEDKPKKRKGKSMADLRAKYSNISDTNPDGTPQTDVRFDDEHGKNKVWVICAGCQDHTEKFTSDLFQSFYCKSCKKPSGKGLAKGKQIEKLTALLKEKGLSDEEISAATSR